MGWVRWAERWRKRLSVRAASLAAADPQRPLLVHGHVGSPSLHALELRDRFCHPEDGPDAVGQSSQIAVAAFMYAQSVPSGPTAMGPA